MFQAMQRTNSNVHGSEVNELSSTTVAATEDVADRVGSSSIEHCEGGVEAEESLGGNRRNVGKRDAGGAEGEAGRYET